jgi:hypothetical protein
MSHLDGIVGWMVSFENHPEPLYLVFRAHKTPVDNRDRYLLTVALDSLPLMLVRENPDNPEGVETFCLISELTPEEYVSAEADCMLEACALVPKTRAIILAGAPEQLGAYTLEPIPVEAAYVRLTAAAVRARIMQTSDAQQFEVSGEKAAIVVEEHPFGPVPTNPLEIN